MTDFIFCDSISIILYISELIDFINIIYFAIDPKTIWIHPLCTRSHSDLFLVFANFIWSIL